MHREKYVLWKIMKKLWNKLFRSSIGVASCLSIHTPQCIDTNSTPGYCKMKSNINSWRCIIVPAKISPCVHLICINQSCESSVQNVWSQPFTFVSPSAVAVTLVPELYEVIHVHLYNMMDRPIWYAYFAS